MKLPVIILLLFMLAGNAHAGVDEYLQKYRDARATQAQRVRVAEYDHLIQYFCSLPYTSNGIEVHPDFIRALILAESNGDPRAVSAKDARGLTQIIYTTGKEAAEDIIGNPAIDINQLEYVTRTKLEKLTPDDLHDPAVNIMLACYLISKYNQDYRGWLNNQWATTRV